MKVKNRLRHLRKNKGLTVREMAKQTGISYPTISRLENGLITYTSEYIYILCNFFNVSSDYLLGIDKRINPKILSKFKEHCKIMREYLKNKDFFSTFLELNNTDREVLKDVVKMSFTLTDEYLYQIKGYILACKENQINQERERSYLKREGKNE